MRRDANNEYRRLLDERPPRLITYVNTPWENAPDAPEFNAAAFRLVERRLKAMGRRVSPDEPAPSQGVLVLGEAGAGKTHLLSRVTRELSAAHPVMFIQKPNNEEAVAQQIWSQLVESLTRHVPGLAPGQSQLDHLLAHVFSAALAPLLERDAAEGLNAKLKQRWAKLLRASPTNLFGMLEGGAGRQKHLDFLRNKVLGHLRVRHPDVDQTVARALVNYCFLANDRDRRATLTWLMGQAIDDTTARRLGLGAFWPEVNDGTSSDVFVRQERERQAIRAIATIGELSKYYGKPLILAFDQLEGMRGETRLTERWGDVAQQLFTVAPNLLVLTCVFPSLWNTWFEPVLHEAVKDRLAQDRIRLEPFGPEAAAALLAAHLRETNEALGLPEPLYPFEPEDVAQLQALAKSPRAFLQRARDRLDEWLFDEEEEQAPRAPAAPARAASESAHEVTLESAVQEAYDRFHARRALTHEHGIPNEEDLFGKLRELLRALGRSGPAPVDFSERAAHGPRVMPSNVLGRPASAQTQTPDPDPDRGPSLCFAVAHSQGNALKARLENLAAVAGTGAPGGCDRFLLLRDARCPAPSGQSAAILESFAQQPDRGRFLAVDAEEWARLQALHDTLVAVLEQDLTAAGAPVAEEEFVRAVRDLGLFAPSPIARAAAELAPWAATLFGIPAPVPVPGPATDASPRAADAPAPKTATPETEPAPAGDSGSPVPEPAVASEIADLLRAVAPRGPAPVAQEPPPPLAFEPWAGRRAVFLNVPGTVEPPDSENDDDRSPRRNPEQTRAALAVVRAALAEGRPPETVAVLAPHAGHVRHIREALEQIHDADADAARVFVGTPAEAPGRKWDLAVVCLTDDGVSPSPPLLGREWLRDAYGRARGQLVVVGNPAYLTNFRFFPVAELLLHRSALARCLVTTRFPE